LPLDESQYVVREDRLWIPVEITRLAQSFLQAWQAGLEELSQLSDIERRRRVVDTADAWQQYPATAPNFEAQVKAPEQALLETAFANQYSALRAQIDEYIDEHYLDSLKQNPENNALRQENGTQKMDTKGIGFRKAIHFENRK